jgi:hypothetical protein
MGGVYEAICAHQSDDWSENVLLETGSRESIEGED